MYYIERIPKPGPCTHFISGYMTSDIIMLKIHSDSEGRKEGRNVLFNDALITFYLRLYGVRHGKGSFR